MAGPSASIGRTDSPGPARIVERVAERRRLPILQIVRFPLCHDFLSACGAAGVACPTRASPAQGSTVPITSPVPRPKDPLITHPNTAASMSSFASTHDIFTQAEPLHQARPSNRKIVGVSPLGVHILELPKLIQAQLTGVHPGRDHADFSQCRNHTLY